MITTSAGPGGPADDVVVVSVTGGVNGVAAAYERVLALADAYDAAAQRMRAWAARGARVLTDPDLLASAPLAPPTFLEAEHDVAAATTGPDGVLVESAGWEGDAAAVRVAVRLLQEGDDLAGDALMALEHLVGRVVVQGAAATAPLWLPLLAGSSSAAGLLWPHLSPATRDALRRRADGAGDDVQRWLGRHPDVVEGLARATGALLLPLRPGTSGAARLLARLYGPGRHRTVPLPGVTVAASARAPRTVEDLVEHLSQLSELSGPDAPGMNGTVEVQSFTGEDGRTRHVVYLPGTDDMTTLPWTQDGDVRDMGANLHLAAGAGTPYGAGVLDALAQAGVGPDDPVLVAGHSQGGMQAAQLLAEDHGYQVTHVVTAGSPTAQLDAFPPGTHVLSLEQHGDVVPLLDGAPNPDSVEQVTVTFDAPGLTGDTVTGHHAYGPYAAGAAAVDTSTDPSVVEQVQSLHDAGFLGAQPSDGVQHAVFQITRLPGAG